MKLNKWTVALAATGVVSLASVAQAEEKASAVLTALSTTTLSGYVDTSAEWNLGTGNAKLPPYRFNAPSKADGFNLDVVQIRLDSPLGENEWAAGYRVDLWAGPDANLLGTQSVLGIGSGGFAIRQAYVALRMPVGNGIDWKVGVFDSIVGYESVEGPSNPNFTRSYGNRIEPTTHTGVLASYRFNDMLSASLGIANTVGPSINSRAFAPVQGTNPYPESYKTYMGSLAITAPDSLGFLAGSTLYGGVVNGFNNSPLNSGFGMPTLNAYVGATIATPVTGLRLGASWDLLNVDTKPFGAASKLEADIWTLAGYLSYQATEKLSFHGRFEYATGDVDTLVGAPGIDTAMGNTPSQQPYPPLGSGLPGGLPTSDGIIATTATIQYDLWQNVLSRIEFRWDHAEHGQLFGGTGAPSRENAFLLAGNIVYKF